MHLPIILIGPEALCFCVVRLSVRTYVHAFVLWEAFSNQLAVDFQFCTIAIINEQNVPQCNDKMLNCVCVSGRDVKCPDAREVIYTIKERQYFEHIEKAYNYASKLLLDLLIQERNLMARLRFVGRRFSVDFISIHDLTLMKLCIHRGLFCLELK